MSQKLRAGGNGVHLKDFLQDPVLSVRRLLGGNRSNGGSPGTAPSLDRSWRLVPKINILVSQRTGVISAPQLRLALLLILLVEGFFIQGWYRGQPEAIQEIDSKKAQFQTLERNLAGQQQKLDALRTQISQLKVQRANKLQEFQTITGENIDWNAVFSRLLSAESSGARFLSVVAQPSGELTLEGIAISPEAPRTLLSQLTSISDVLDLQSLRWAQDNDPPSFTAIFRVRR